MVSKERILKCCRFFDLFSNLIWIAFNWNFDQNFHLWPELSFLTKIFIYYQNFHFSPKFQYLTKISIFYQDFDCWPKFQFLTKISIFDQNFNFRPKSGIPDVWYTMVTDLSALVDCVFLYFLVDFGFSGFKSFSKSW